jgi:hypothetical protein
VRRTHAFTIAQGAYFYGLETDRPLAAKILRRLLLKPYAALPAASFLLALYTPRIVTAALGPAVRALWARGRPVMGKGSQAVRTNET